MNIYDLYIANGNSAGFCVQRESWGNCIAIIVSISGQTEGPLRGKPPYFGNPHVAMDIYNFKTRVLLEKNADLSCPGSGEYALVEKPAWLE